MLFVLMSGIPCSRPGPTTTLYCRCPSACRAYRDAPQRARFVKCSALLSKLSATDIVALSSAMLHRLHWDATINVHVKFERTMLHADGVATNMACPPQDLSTGAACGTLSSEMIKTSQRERDPKKSRGNRADDKSYFWDLKPAQAV